jgi:hypothetical protein
MPTQQAQGPSARSGWRAPRRRFPTPGKPMRHALNHYLQLGSVRDTDWVAAHFGHR